MTGSPPSTALLLDWLEGRLPDESAANLAQAVADDPSLQAQVAWWRAFLRISRGAVLADPPAGLLRQLQAPFAAYARQQRGPGPVRAFIAALTDDSWQRLALAGVRNTSLRHAPRQMIYSSEVADVALNIQAGSSDATFDMEGQIFALADYAAAEFVVQLVQEGVERRLALSDELGKFSLASLPAGGYALWLSSDQGEIEISPIELV